MIKSLWFDVSGVDEVEFAAMFEHGAVDAAVFCLQPAFVDPLSGRRVRRIVFEHEDIAMRIVVVRFVGGGVVQPPLAVEEMQLRRPDRRRILAARRRTPDDDRLRLAELRHVGGFPKRDAIAERVHVVVDAIVGDDPWIGAGGQQRFRMRGRSTLDFHRGKTQKTEEEDS